MAEGEELTDAMSSSLVKGLGLKKEKLERVVKGMKEGKHTDELDLAIAFDMNPAELGWNFGALESLLKALQKISC